MPTEPPDRTPTADAPISPEQPTALESMAHDLNDLLTIINGYSDLLLKQLEPGDAREQVASIRQAGARAAEINRRLVGLARPGQPGAEFSENGAAESAVRPPAQTVVLENQPGGTETILLVDDQGDVGRVTGTVLRRFGYNVLTVLDAEQALAQAADYAGPIHLLITDIVLPSSNGRELASRVVASRPEIKVLYVSGYPRKNLESRKLLEKGAPFLAKPFRPDALAAAVRGALGPAQAPATVLVVDDEEAVRKFVGGVLESAGYDVVLAGDGLQAHRVARSQPLDLVVMDLVMPEREGLETIAAMLRDQPDLKIIAISGFGGPFLHVAKKLGARAAMAKPISPDDLLRVARDVIAS